MVLDIFFMVFASLAVGGAIFVVTARHPVKSVLSLVFTFVMVAGTWMLLDAEFLSLVLVVVYVGAVMVLFLFVVMMLDCDAVSRKKTWVAYWPFAFLMAAVFFGLLFQLLGHFNLAQSVDNLQLDTSNLTQVGLYLFSAQLYPMLLAALILLVAMIAAISLNLRERSKNTKAQRIQEQLRASSKNRLKLLDVYKGGL